MANSVYNKAKQLIASNDLDLVSDTIKILLVVGYTVDIDNHEFYSDISAYEVDATVGYTSGGQSLSARAFVRDDLNNRTKFSASDVTWSESIITANGAIIYKSYGGMGTSPLVCYVDFGSNKTTNNTSLTIEWSDEDGIIYIT